MGFASSYDITRLLQFVFNLPRDDAIQVSLPVTLYSIANPRVSVGPCRGPEEGHGLVTWSGRGAVESRPR